MIETVLTSLVLALREIRRHPLRSFLTVLGIVIGVASVVTMVTLGRGTTVAVQQQISSLGADILQIRPGQGFGRGGGGQQPVAFEPDDVLAIQQEVAGLRGVAPVIQSSGLAVRNADNWSTSIVGTSNVWLSAQSWRLAEGREFSAAEQSGGRPVCILGETLRQALFRADSAIGQTIRIRDLACEVIGTLAPRGQGFGADQDDVLVMPAKIVQRRITGLQRVSMILVSLDPTYDSAAAQETIRGLLRERRNLGQDKADDFNIFDTRQISQTMQGATQALTTLLGAVAAVSLIVGGIGIMNIMLVSVTERTREIGIRLAIGAFARDVLLQFLVEAVVLALLGGLLGLLAAFLAGWILAPTMQVPFIFDPVINLLAFAFSALIGILFGFLPARRAAHLNPIEALHHE